MMEDIRVISFPDAKNIVICGDIHGEFNSLIYKSCIQYNMTDTLLIVAGDCGFGFSKMGYYEAVFNRNSSRLTKSNNWIVMVRGNHDDPSYFNDELISHSRFRTVPDYGVIQACGHNILCIGGAVSIDRVYRKEDDRKHISSTEVSYWPTEIPIYEPMILDSICARLKIDTVVTHTSPSFCELFSRVGLSQWAEKDQDLMEDCDKERKVMDQIFNHLISAGQPLSHWYYGHFHQSWNSEIQGVLFTMLDVLELKELR